MKRTLMALVTGLTVGVFSAPAGATPASCTIVTDGLTLLSHVPSAGDFSFPIGIGGQVLPMDIDESNGTITVRRAGLSNLSFVTDGGTIEFQWAGPDVVGTIDAGGNISLPGFGVTTVFSGLPLPITPTLATAPQALPLGGKEYVNAGVRLDFATGIVTLDGGGIIPNAPIVNSPVISDLRLTCQLAPIPDPAKLPGAPTAKLSSGRAKIGTGADDDRLQLKAKFVAGATAPDFAGSDLVMQVTAGTPATSLALVVRAGSLTRKGKKLTVRDDGSAGTFRVIPSPTGDQRSVAGVLTVMSGKNGSSLSLQLSGLDVSWLSQSGTVRITVGTNEAVATVSVRTKGKTRLLI